MTITTYTYVPESGAGSVFLSLVTGGMRAITGLIGKKSPTQVGYRAGTATIGIRGTDITIVTANGNVLVSVTEGTISFTQGTISLTLTAGDAVLVKADGTVVRGAEAFRQMPPVIREAIDEFVRMVLAIIAAGPGTPRGGGDNEHHEGGNGQQGHGGQQGGGGGGGQGSGH